MIESDRETIAHTLLDRLDPDEPVGRVEIDALLQWWTGRRVSAARMLAGTDADPSRLRSFYTEAGMLERAVASVGSDRITARLRETFLSTYRKPAMIRPTFDHIRRLQRLSALGDQESVRGTDE